MEKPAKEKCEVRWGSTEPLIVGNKVYVSSNDCHLTEKELEIARIELGETEEKKHKYLEEIKNELSKEGNYRMDDDFLLRFLRVRKFDKRKAYENIKKFYKMRNKHFDFYGIPAELKAYTSFKFITLLPYANQDGRSIIWVDPEFWNPETMPFEEFIQPVAALCDVIIANPRLQVKGIITIADMKKVGWEYAPPFLWGKRFVSLISMGQALYPWRINKILILGTNQLIQMWYSICRPFLSKKIVERVFLLGSDPSELHEHIDPAVLPKKLGGMLDDDFCKRPELILDNIPYLEYDRSFTGLH